MPDTPPMDPHTDEASPDQLAAARREGDAYGASLDLMVSDIARTGGSSRAGDYEVAYAIEEAEGLYELTDDGLVWREPERENTHVEIAVRDAADGRFVPGLTVRVTITGPDGREVGSHVQPLVWHPMLYHYARNWRLPGPGAYHLTVQIEPPTFMRHDEVNGRRFAEPVTVRFDDIEIGPRER